MLHHTPELCSVLLVLFSCVSISGPKRCCYFSSLSARSDAAAHLLRGFRSCSNQRTRREIHLGWIRSLWRIFSLGAKRTCLKWKQKQTRFLGCQQMQGGGIQASPKWGVSHRSDLSVLCRGLLFMHVECRLNNEQKFTQSTKWIIFLCKKNQMKSTLQEMTNLFCQGKKNIYQIYKGSIQISQWT